jgi:hypothetical protein
MCLLVTLFEAGDKMPDGGIYMAAANFQKLRQMPGAYSKATALRVILASPCFSPKPGTLTGW